MPQPLVISHRTNMGDTAENSLAGIDAALRDGADGVEIDVRCTRDGRVVLMHDAVLARTTGDPRAVAGVSYADLESLRLRGPDGSSVGPVPTLADALARVAGKALLVIEVKQEGIHEAVAAEVRAAKAAPWCWIWAFDPGVAAACRSAMPGVPVALNASGRSLEQHAPRQEPVAAAVTLAVRHALAGVSFAHRLIDGPAVERARHYSLAVYTWTVNEPQDIQRVDAAGVDGVCSDRPALVRALLTQVGRDP